MRIDREPNISHPPRPSLVNKYFITKLILDTKLFENLTREALRLFPAAYGYFVNNFEKNARAGPYGSYDNKQI